MRGADYPVENDGDGTLGVDGGLVAAQLGDLAEEQDGAVDVVVQVDGGDARGDDAIRGHCCWQPVCFARRFEYSAFSSCWAVFLPSLSLSVLEVE